MFDRMALRFINALLLVAIVALGGIFTGCAAKHETALKATEVKFHSIALPEGLKQISINDAMQRYPGLVGYRKEISSIEDSFVITGRPDSKYQLLKDLSKTKKALFVAGPGSYADLAEYFEYVPRHKGSFSEDEPGKSGVMPIFLGKEMYSVRIVGDDTAVLVMLLKM